MTLLSIIYSTYAQESGKLCSSTLIRRLIRSPISLLIWNTTLV
ncbi:hypothetical protein LINPERHAP2_LOCUS32342 [Linum perenne]